jgi:hypothetical protein
MVQRLGWIPVFFRPMKFMKMVLGGLLLVLVSCGSASDLPPRPDTPIANEFVDLVALEAEWKCDVERYAFEDLDSLTAELDKRLERDDITSQEYQTFILLLDEDEDLRLHVRWAYEDRCN